MSMSSIVAFALYVFALLCLVALVRWVLTQFPQPEPLNRIINVGIVVIAVLIIIVMLLALANGTLYLPGVVVR